MNGDIPMAELTRELFAYLTQGTWVDQEAGRREATHCRDASRSWFAAPSGRLSVDGNQKRGWSRPSELDKKLSRLGRRTGDPNLKQCPGGYQGDGTHGAHEGLQFLRLREV